MLCKKNASISGAEVGCQGEVGVACAMAAAGLVAALGGSNEPDRERGRNRHRTPPRHDLRPDRRPGADPLHRAQRHGRDQGHHRGLAGLKGDGTHFVSLDDVIETMRQTGADMQVKYKETSLGGLAIHVVTVNHAACLPFGHGGNLPYDVLLRRPGWAPRAQRELQHA
jgi:L-serine dehydratase